MPTFALDKPLNNYKIMKTNETWKPIMIGGMTGIVFGAGGMYAVQKGSAIRNEENFEHLDADNELKMATSVNDDQNFNDAFATARSEVGAGGVFTWHGNVYGTYSADEWNAMSLEDKNNYANRVYASFKPVTSEKHQQGEDEEVAQSFVVEPDETEDVQIVVNDYEQNDAVVNTSVQEDVVEDDSIHLERTEGIEKTQEADNEGKGTGWNSLANNDNDVRIVGIKEIEIGESQTMIMQELQINGQRVAVIDVDKDGVADFAMSDLNNNRLMDEGEVIDLRTGESIAFTNDDSSMDIMPEDTII